MQKGDLPKENPRIRYRRMLIGGEPAETLGPRGDGCSFGTDAESQSETARADRWREGRQQERHGSRERM